ncbi:MAG: polyhydroxyalkanoate depolymerase, partial [Fimbriimonadaceae bacterium]|nr:polyhydroxyalkanoate depolymerase [Alphaproteobacteria bacterium]
MLYYFYELNHAVMSPARAMADAGRLYLRNPLNPVSHTLSGKNMSAMLDVFERVTRRYGKPDFGITHTEVGGKKIAVSDVTVWEKPFCRLINFTKQQVAKPQPKLLLVAPMSGHYATLLRGTVEAMLPDHDVYITDWIDARMVPLADGDFDLDDYVDYIVE